MKRSRGISALKCLKTKVFKDNAPASLIYRFLAKKNCFQSRPHGISGGLMVVGMYGNIKREIKGCFLSHPG